jgi:hypothetical protein
MITPDKERDIKIHLQNIQNNIPQENWDLLCQLYDALLESNKSVKSILVEKATVLSFDLLIYYRDSSIISFDIKYLFYVSALLEMIQAGQKDVIDLVVTDINKAIDYDRGYLI